MNQASGLSLKSFKKFEEILKSFLSSEINIKSAPFKVR